MDSQSLAITGIGRKSHDSELLKVQEKETSNVTRSGNDLKISETKEEFCWAALLGKRYYVSTVGKDENTVREYPKAGERGQTH